MMRRLRPLTCEIVFWLCAAAVLAVVIGLETGWGQRLRPVLPAAAPVKSTYTPPELVEPPKPRPMDEYMDFALRPLFVFTRKPPPPAPPPPPPPKPQMQKGRFALVGVTIIPGKKMAYLYHLGSGRTYGVFEGQAVDGAQVVRIDPEVVILSQHDDSETVVLRAPNQLRQQALQITTPVAPPVVQPAATPPPAVTPRPPPAPTAAPVAAVPVPVPAPTPPAAGSSSGDPREAAINRIMQEQIRMRQQRPPPPQQSK